MISHQYVEREALSIRTEELYWDRLIHFLYSRVREDSPALFRALTGSRTSKVLSFFTYDALLGKKLSRNESFLRRQGIDLQECVEDSQYYNTPRRIFERQIRY